MKRALIFLIFVVMLASLAVMLPLLAGCGKQQSAPIAPTPKPVASTPLSAESPPATTKILIEDSAGKILWAISPKEGAYGISDGAGQAIGEVKVEADRVKVKDSSGKVIWKIKKKENGCKLYDGSDKEIYRIKRKEGGFRIRDTRDTELYSIKPKEGYLEIKGPPRIKIKSEGEKVTIKGDSGTIYKVRSGLSQEEACFLGLTNLDPMQRIGLVIFFKSVK